jgi:ergothioneine biosynthesis protein EgtB
MPDASPTKWHLAHTTWFFETFILAEQPGYAPFDPAFGFLFNSYYESVGPRQARPQRGLLTRPSLETVMSYRRHVDEAMERLLAEEPHSEAMLAILHLGLNHEQQHQELILTDIQHLLSQNPLQPAYDPALAALRPTSARSIPSAEWIAFDGGLVQIGADADGPADDFVFDNESPRHEVFLQPYRLSDRLITNAEWAAFIDDDGYRRADLWLAEGWSRVQEEGWTAPLYWSRRNDGGWTSFTLAGRLPLDPEAPVVHVSFY